MKLAKKSGFGDAGKDNYYECKFDWPDDCSVQCGDRGIVLSANGSYRTAFFEAFPKDPKTFIRGQGETIEMAERAAWNNYERIVGCNSHEFERRGYKNGSGICKHCELFKSNVFEPSERCVVCNQPTYWTADVNGNYYCEEHERQMPDDAKPSWMKDLESAI